MSELYVFDDDSKNPWSRDDLNLVSDFSARQGVMLDIIASRPEILIDLGCGEGFIARKTQEYWTAYHGIDNSEDQISHAKNRSGGNCNFYLMDMNEIDQLCEKLRLLICGSQNCCFIGIFSISYLKVNVAKDLIKTIWDIQSPGDSGIFTLPHPLVTSSNYLNNDFFRWEKVDYFESDKFVNGQMAGIDGTQVKVGCFHKTFEDVIDIFQPVFESEVVEFKELKLESDLCPANFSSLINMPLHLKVKWRK